MTMTSDMPKRDKLLIGNEWVDGNADPIRVIDPSTGKHWTDVHAASEAQIDKAVAAARLAMADPNWGELGGNTRANLLMKLADLIDANLDELAHLDARNVGMPLFLAKAMLPAAANEIRYNAGWCTRMNGETIPVDLPWPTHAYTVREPVGVVAAIVPWNVPLSTAVVKIAPALAAGCAIVLKPAELTPLSALRLGELALEAGFPAGVLNVVPGLGSVAGAALAAHGGVDKITFTGSTATGRSIVDAARGNFKRVTLELGGKSPMMILADADLDKASAAAARSIFINSGQVCSAGSRLYADSAVYGQVKAKLIEAAEAHVLGEWDDKKATMGPLISEGHRERVDGFVRQAKKDGAKILTGGKAPDRAGWFYPPTVIEVDNDDLAICREEVFGPVLVIQPVNGHEEMVRRANESDFGLAAYIWTGKVEVAQQMAREINTGGVFINSPIVAGPNVPFGGTKQSGWGRERGREGFESFLQTKSIAYAL